MEWMIVVVGIALLAAAWLARWRWLSAVLFPLSALVLVIGICVVWYWNRPLPANTQETLFQGITYQREVRQSPRPLVIHLLRVDLTAPGIGFLVTPAEPHEGRQLRAQTVSQFLQRHDLQIAINGDFFEPWWSNSPFDYYPHVGDPVDVFGVSSSEGDVYSQGQRNHVTVYFSADNQVSIGEPVGEIYNALSGNTLLLVDGQPQPNTDDAYLRDLHPRTALGIDERGETLFIIVVDGRQPSYSEGASLPELSAMLLEYGAWDAVNMDGGGSTTMVMSGTGGRTVQLNSPIDNRLPGHERPVANHLGIFALPSG